MKTTKVSRSLVYGFGFENQRRNSFEEHLEQKNQNRRVVRFKMADRDNAKRNRKLFG